MPEELLEENKNVPNSKNQRKGRMSNSLKLKTMHGVFWSLFERGGQQGIRVVISIILARVLLPAQFGLIGMLAIDIRVKLPFFFKGTDKSV